MTQYWFATLDEGCIPPKGFVDTFEAFNRFGFRLYEDSWQGEEEAILKYQDVDDVDKERVDAVLRAEVILSEMRELLVANALIAIGVGEDAEITKLGHNSWCSKFAPPALYSGKISVADGRIISPSNDPNAPPLVLMFNEKSLDKAISKRVLAQKLDFSQIFEKAKSWMVQHINRSPLKRPKNKFEFRDEFSREVGPYIPNTKWQTVWNAAIEETGAVNWKKKGAPKM